MCFLLVEPIRWRLGKTPPNHLEKTLRKKTHAPSTRRSQNTFLAASHIFSSFAQWKCLKSCLGPSLCRLHCLKCAPKYCLDMPRDYCLNMPEIDPRYEVNSALLWVRFSKSLICIVLECQTFLSMKDTFNFLVVRPLKSQCRTRGLMFLVVKPLLDDK